MTHPVIRDLFNSLGRHASFQELLRRLQSDAAPRLSLSGLTPTAKALYTVLLWQATERPLLVVVEGPKEAEALTESVSTFFDLLASDRSPSRPQLLPALDVLPSQRLSPHSEISEERAIALWRLSSERVPVTVTPVASALLRRVTLSLADRNEWQRELGVEFLGDSAEDREAVARIREFVLALERFQLARRVDLTSTRPW